MIYFSQYQVLFATSLTTSRKALLRWRIVRFFSCWIAMSPHCKCNNYFSLRFLWATLRNDDILNYNSALILKIDIEVISISQQTEEQGRWKTFLLNYISRAFEYTYTLHQLLHSFYNRNSSLYTALFTVCIKKLGAQYAKYSLYANRAQIFHRRIVHCKKKCLFWLG